MRKLVTIRKIHSILPIDGADNIQLAKVDGWQVVVKKGEFKEGDLGLYFEVDSFLPIQPQFEFLRKSSFRKMGEVEGFRLKTVRLRGELSQGLLLPLDLFNLGEPDFEMDYSPALGVQKWEPPVPAELNGVVKGSFPGFIPKTDEERIQNLVKNWERIKSSGPFYSTEKLDGTSFTAYLIGEDCTFGVCSRNLELEYDPNNTYWKVANHYGLKENLASLPFSAAVQGEIVGEGIQGNPYGIKGQELWVFNILNLDNGEYLGLKEFQETCEYLSLTTVPVLDTDFTLPDTVEELLLMADGKSKLNPKTVREGLVIRSWDRKVSFKVISNKFLLKEKG